MQFFEVLFYLKKQAVGASYKSYKYLNSGIL